MKRFLPYILSMALLLSLAACHPTGEAPSPTPQETLSPPPSLSVPSSAPADPIPDDSPVLSAAPAEPTPAGNYIFVIGQFLGCWSDGWHSAHNTDFTLGEVFNRDYYDWQGNPVQAVRFFIADGPGAFDDPAQAASLLKPFGIIEGDDFIMPMPGQLTGTAAALRIPSYGFYARFDGQTHRLISTVEMSPLDEDWVSPCLSGKQLSELLKEEGISCDVPRMDRITFSCDIDNDGQPEYLEFIRTPEDDAGFAVLEPGDPIFYALFLVDGEDTTLVAAEHIDYTTDVTAHFSMTDLLFCDFNQDGICEISFRHCGWEGGHYAAFTLQDGTWSECLRAEYGT